MLYVVCKDIHVYTVIVPVGNRIYGNRAVLDDAIEHEKCLFSISGDKSYPMHNFYRLVYTLHLCTYMLLG